MAADQDVRRHVRGNRSGLEGPREVSSEPASSTRPLRVHFFTSYVHEQGTYFRYHNLAIGLANLGHRVTVYGCDLKRNAVARREERDGVRYEIVPECRMQSIFSQMNNPLTAARRFARHYPPCDIGHLFQPFLGAAAAWRRCPARARFYDWDDQWTGGLISGPVQSSRDRWMRFATRLLEDRLPRWATHVIAVGDYLGEMALKRAAAGVTIVPNGYWPAPFADKTTARSKLGLKSNAFYVGFMGRTSAELPWCVDAMTAVADQYPTLRLAVCGPPIEDLGVVPTAIGERIDYLGRLSAADTRDFAAALDLGLLPLADIPFNRSRFPIKFCEHLATGNPLLCSEIGAIGRLVREFDWAIPAGTTRDEWCRSFALAVKQMVGGNRRQSDLVRFAERMSWAGLARQLETAYRTSLGASAKATG
ncbi:MAG: hypothetical protein C0467_13735 [Planctomycetaceae bacterium]|nr:hypothetical protein [Planctomycetaceae bacterium]